MASCGNVVPKPATGQTCPLFSVCKTNSDCGVFQDCQLWNCYLGKCDLDALSNCGKTAGGQCNADVVVTHQFEPPVEKDFLAPDGVSFREVASIAFTVQNNTAKGLYFRQVPLALDLGGNASGFDVSAVKLFEDGGGAEHEPGDMLTCSANNPFAGASTMLLGACSNSSFSYVLGNGQSQRFLVNVAFAATKTFIAGRSYRLRIPSPTGFELANGLGVGATKFSGTICGIPAQGFTGAWVYAK